MLRMCCLRWSGRQKYLPQRVQVKVYREPKRPHSYLECRVRDDRDLYPRPHITHRYRSSSPPSPVETRSVARLAASIQGGLFTSYGFLSKAHETSPIREISLEYLLQQAAKHTLWSKYRSLGPPFFLFLFFFFSDRRRKSSNQACRRYWIKLAPKKDCAKSCVIKIGPGRV